VGIFLIFIVMKPTLVLSWMVVTIIKKINTIMMKNVLVFWNQQEYQLFVFGITMCFNRWKLSWKNYIIN